jgi:hypothetical protein
MSKNLSQFFHRKRQKLRGSHLPVLKRVAKAALTIRYNPKETKWLLFWLLPLLALDLATNTVLDSLSESHVLV